jgi:hypothetical protein
MKFRESPEAVWIRRWRGVEGSILNAEGVCRSFTLFRQNPRYRPFLGKTDKTEKTGKTLKPRPRPIIDYLPALRYTEKNNCLKMAKDENN